jgi:hypothetical protein
VIETVEYPRFVWVVGKMPESGRWELQGIYDEHDDAVQACVEVNYFVAPVRLNYALPEEARDWPGCYYPLTPSGYIEPPGFWGIDMTVDPPVAKWFEFDREAK